MSVSEACLCLASEILDHVEARGVSKQTERDIAYIIHQKATRGALGLEVLRYFGPPKPNSPDRKEIDE